MYLSDNELIEILQGLSMNHHKRSDLFNRMEEELINRKRGIKGTFYEFMDKINNAEMDSKLLDQTGVLIEPKELSILIDCLLLVTDNNITSSEITMRRSEIVKRFKMKLQTRYGWMP